jgi:hypothetical protein
MYERFSYKDIREMFLENYYLNCRSVLWSKREWHPEEAEFAYAYDGFDGAFQHPLENLMLEVLTVIMIAGRHEQPEKFHREKIKKILEMNNLEELKKLMSENVPASENDEKHELLHDLKILGFIAN